MNGNWFAKTVGTYRGRWDQIPYIATSALPAADTVAAFSFQLVGDPGTWLATGLPVGGSPGWAISSGGLLTKSGTTPVGTVNPVFTLTTSNGRSVSVTLPLTTNVSGALVAETAMPDATEGAVYSHTIPMTGAGTLTMSILGSIPGLSIASSGAVTGTPTTPGDFQVLVTPISSVNGAGTPGPVKLHVAPIDAIAAAVTPRWITDRPGAGPFSKRRNR